MSDLLINFRVFSFHLKLSKRWRPSISRNGWHKKHSWPDGRFSVYNFFWYECD